MLSTSPGMFLEISSETPSEIVTEIEINHLPMALPEALAEALPEPPVETFFAPASYNSPLPTKRRETDPPPPAEGDFHRAKRPTAPSNFNNGPLDMNAPKTLAFFAVPPLPLPLPEELFEAPEEGEE